MTPVAYSKPLLQAGAYIVADYGKPWIEQLLLEAAAEAGVTLPCASEVAEGVLIYLQEACPLPTMPIHYLFGRMRRLLREIGLPLVAAHLHDQLPPVDIELDALAGENPLPLFFYTKLREQMDKLRKLGMTTCRFSGARRCSMVLGSRRRACPTQRRELQELRSFLATQTAA